MDPTGAGKRILIVDDNEVILKNLKRLLEKKGYAVETAANGRTGMDKAKEFNPHLVLLDVEMPAMNGLQCLKELKQNFADIEVIMLAAGSSPEVTREAANLGAYEFVLKPPNIGLFLEIIEHALGKTEKTPQVIRPVQKITDPK